ncbi:MULTISPECIES: protein kinase [Acinetobacter]|uniref:protein kinase domain-containing protein n=1 Tax=Acinetobacter TaxID=469 RepID=UPI000235FC14|nr:MULTISPECIES: protein kinase [Acinetobacter]KXZ74774.1 Serine/threonine-protein kinase StkP [Acinetobacter venetianus]GAB00895.1 putative serine/threonine protein kinase [Acinetobacter sp. NBRC 100985]
MSIITSIFDHNFQPTELTLKTKKQSYESGRRLYTFKNVEQRYWLKYHHADTHSVLEQSFQNELSFYKQFENREISFLLPHHIIHFQEHIIFQDLIEHGEGLLLPDSGDFFADLSTYQEIDEIQQKILSALSALQSFHKLGWVHGDLKTEHFRCFENTCRLIDLEQSFVQESNKQTSLNATPHYMAPELFHGISKTVQSDLYAFGIILYEWLTQSRLTAKTYQDWAVLHCQQLQIQLPDRFKQFLPLLNGLLQKHVTLRVPSAQDAIDVLKIA